MPVQRQTMKTYLTAKEYGAIQASASRAGLSLSTFSKRVCLGMEVKSLEHEQFRLELRRIKGDLGRVGGLLKQALAEGADKHAVYRLLRELDARQRELQAAIARV